MMGIKEDSRLWFINFLTKSLKVVSGVANNMIKQNLQLVKELHKPIVRNFKKEQFILDLTTIFGC